MDSLHHLQEVLPTEVGYNPRNWVASDKESFKVRLTASDVPEDTFAGLSTELFFVAKGGRSAVGSEGLRAYEQLQPLIREINAADERIDAAKEAGTAPSAADLRFVEENRDRANSVMSPETQAKNQALLAKESDDYIWLNVWKLGVPPVQAKSTKYYIDVAAVFGRDQIDAVSDGLLVCEMHLLGGRIERGGQVIQPPNGIDLGRYKIEREKDAKGAFTHRHTIEPFANGDVFLDMLMSFVRSDDDRLRFLQLEYFAPDEDTYSWFPVAQATFPIYYVFTSNDLEVSLMDSDSDYLKLDVAQRRQQVRATLTQGQHTAAFKKTPEFFTVMDDKLDDSKPALAKERAIYLFNDERKAFKQLKRAIDMVDVSAGGADEGQEDAAIQSAISKALEEAKRE